MGLFDGVFGKKDKIKEEANLNWLPLTSIAQIEEISAESKSEAVFIFKHSTRCGISKMVIKQFERLFTEAYKNTKVYYLDLLNHRDISNELASIFEVVHQSPQVLVIKNGTCVFNTSHEDIAAINLSRFL